MQLKLGSVRISLVDGLAGLGTSMWLFTQPFWLSRRIILTFSFPLLKDSFIFPPHYLPLSPFPFSASLSSAWSSGCLGIIFPQKPFRGSFVNAAQNMNFTWVAHRQCSHCPPCPTQPNKTLEVHESTGAALNTVKTSKILLVDEYWSTQHA